MASTNVTSTYHSPDFTRLIIPMKIRAKFPTASGRVLSQAGPKRKITAVRVVQGFRPDFAGKRNHHEKTCICSRSSCFARKAIALYVIELHSACDYCADIRYMRCVLDILRPDI